jgi:3-dehydroquinate synthase
MRVRVRAPVGAQDYDVVVERGALRSPEPWLRAARIGGACAIVTDATVAGIYGGELLSAVRATGRTAELVSFPAGESHKTRATWTRVTDALLAAGFGRDACVLALGGGVAGDVGGFVAATYMRGVPVVQIPTTLLAMVDAAIGGKTGVDTPAGKNLVGAFLHPRLVLADPVTLDTLSAATFADGLAEAVKHAAIADAEHLAWIVANAAALRGREPAAIDALIGRSVAIKAAFVAEDPEERAARAALNFGHTLAHALERASDYRLSHGRAVAIGLVAEARIGETLGITARGTAAALVAALAALGLEHALPDLPAERIVAATAGDKKSRAGRVRYTLLERIGSCARTATGEWTHAIDTDAVIAALGMPPNEPAAV